TPCASTGSTCSMVLIRVRPFLFARTMMSFHKILRITEHPCRADDEFSQITRRAEHPRRADKSAMCAINRHLLVDEVVYLHASSSMQRAKEDISPVPVRSGDRSCALPPPLSSGRAGAAECP